MTTIDNPIDWDEWLKTRKGELVNKMGKEVSEALDIPQELKDYREAWKNKKRFIDNEAKEKIIKVVDKIPVKVEIDSDGSRLVEFKLWNKTYKILDPRLKIHSDDEYFRDAEYIFITKRNEWVELSWMWWDDVDAWENQKLKKYVKEKQRKWLYIPKIEEMENILAELWEVAELDKESDQIAMLMYLTWMDWDYWLSMEWFRDSRFSLMCRDNNCWFSCEEFDDDYANLCMISCE